MMVSTTTDRSQTIKRKIESTSATALATKKDRGEAVTELRDLCPFEPIIECSTIKPGYRIGSYPLAEDDDFAYWGVLMGGSLHNRTAYRSTGWACDFVYAAPHHGALRASCSANSNLQASLVCTNGQGCTIIENRGLELGVCAAIPHPWAHVVTVLGSGSGSYGTVFIIGEEGSVFDQAAVESLRQAKRRHHRKLAYQLAMAGLKAAEESRAHAVEAEAKLGIDWDDWEDKSR
jgi:hypothetical protein